MPLPCVGARFCWPPVVSNARQKLRTIWAVPPKPCATRSIRLSRKAWSVSRTSRSDRKPCKHSLTRQMRSVAIPVTPESTDLRQSNELLAVAVGRRGLLRTGFDGEPGTYRDYPTCSQAAWGRMAASQTLDHQSRSGVRQKKTTARHASLLWHSAADGKLATLMKCGGAELANRTCTVGVNRTSHCGGLELSAAKNDPDPKALACYGMLSADNGCMHLRFVSGRPERGGDHRFSGVAV